MSRKRTPGAALQPSPGLVLHRMNFYRPKRVHAGVGVSFHAGVGVSFRAGVGVSEGVQAFASACRVRISSQMRLYSSSSSL